MNEAVSSNSSCFDRAKKIEIINEISKKQDSKANDRSVDSLMNFETVKYFNNEVHEYHRYEAALGEYNEAAQKNQSSLAILNSGQAFIIAIGGRKKKKFKFTKQNNSQLFFYFSGHNYVNGIERGGRWFDDDR